MSYLLELLGKGLQTDLVDVLTEFFWTPGGQDLEQMLDSAQAHPDLPELQLQIGSAYLRQLDYDKARTHLQAAMDLEDSFAVRCALACLDDETGQAYKALEHLQRAHESRPDEPLLLYGLGYCCERVGKTEQAAEIYTRCVELDEEFCLARHRLAAVNLALQDLAGAIEQYAALRNLEPEQGWVRSVLGHLYYRAGRYSDAVGEFETSIAMEPENWAMSDEDVEHLVSTGQVEKAVLQLERLIDQQGPFPDLYVRLGDLLSQSGHDDDALQAYREALDLQANYLEAMVKIGTHHLIYGRWEEAAESFFQAAELNDSLLMNYVGTGAAMLADNRRNEAMRSFDLAAAVEPNSTLLLTEMTRLQLKSAMADQFSEDFAAGQSISVRELEVDGQELIARQIQRHKAQLQRRPDQADVRYRYGVLLRSEGRLEEAREQFELACQIRPPYTIAMLKLGITLQELGEIEAAIDAFRKAMDIQQDQIDQHYRLGLLYTDRQRFEQAVREMEQAEDDTEQPPQIRTGLALSLQHMGLLDRAAAAWRSLNSMTPPAASSEV
ncbi:MAG: tetratricopeptide repeat protein [Phycisphaerae bacterium]